MKKDDTIKVNTAFCGEFEFVNGDEIINVFHYFTTSNNSIHRDTYLDIWFQENVEEPILQELDKLRERY